MFVDRGRRVHVRVQFGGCNVLSRCHCLLSLPVSGLGVTPAFVNATLTWGWKQQGRTPRGSFGFQIQNQILNSPGRGQFQ